jgi:diacylglycerol O-acyltransferase
MAPARVQRQLSALGSSMWALGEAEPFLDTVINGLLYLDVPVDLAALRARVGEVFAVHPRFRMVVRHREGGSLEWDEPTAPLDLAYHVRDVMIPSASGSATQAEVEAYIGGKYGELLDKERPLWLVERVVNAGAVGPERKSKGLVILRLHHVIGDGISLTAFVMGLFDQDGGAVGIEGASAAAGKQLQQDAGAGGDASSSKVGAARWPRRSALLAALHHARLVVQGVLEGLLFVALPGDSATMLHAPVTSLGRRKVVSSPVVPLQRVKDIKDAVGATVNDVLVAALAGAVRAYLLSHGSVVGPKLRAGCLLNMRSAAETKKLQALRGGAVPLSNQVRGPPAQERARACKREEESERGSEREREERDRGREEGTRTRHRTLTDRRSLARSRSSTSCPSPCPSPRQGRSSASMPASGAWTTQS